MPSVSSPLGTTQSYIPIVPTAQIGRAAGLHMHFATMTALNTAITDERTNITNGSAIWADGQIMTVGTEKGAGVRRSWDATAQHARTVHLGSGKTVLLAGDANTVIASAGTPGSGVGANGDLAIDTTNGVYHVKSGGAWGSANSIAALHGPSVVAVLDAQLGGSGWQSGGGGGGSVTLSDITDMTADARALNAGANYAAMRSLIGLVPGTDVLVYSAKIQAIAALTASPDTIAYFTGSGSAALAPFTTGGRALVNSAGTASTFPYFSSSNTVTLASITASGLAILAAANAGAQLTALGLSANGQSLVTAANYGAMRTLIGLVPGTDVQTYSAALASIASQTTAADRMLYTTGSNAYAVTTLTSAGRALLDDADSAAMRTTLSAQLALAFQDEGVALGTTGTADTINFTGTGITASRVGNVLTVNVNSGSMTDATTGANGAVRLAGALGGTATAPTALGYANAAALAADLAAKAPLNVVPEAIATGGAYTLQVSDAGKVRMGVDTNPQTINITTAFNGLGCTIIWPASAGDITLDANAGVNLNGLGDGNNIVLSSAGGSVTILPTGTNTFMVIGSIGNLVASDITNATATGLALITAANAAAGQTALSLVPGTNVQAYSTNLAALAGLSSAANTLPYFTGVGAAAVTTLTAAGRAILDDTDATAQRATLGVVIGTDVQAQNAYLAKIAAAVPRTVTGATALTATDVDGILTYNSGSTAALTVGSDATLTPVAGKSVISVFIAGAGVPTFTASGSTILGTPRAGLAQNDFIILIHVNDNANSRPNTWAYA